MVVGDNGITRKAALPKDTFNPWTELVALTLVLHWGDERESTSALIACMHLSQFMFTGSFIRKGGCLKKKKRFKKSRGF